MSKVTWQEAASLFSQPSRWRTDSFDLDPSRSNTWFPGPMWISSPNGISIGLAVFYSPTQTTLRATSVAIGRISYTGCRRCGL